MLNIFVVAVLIVLNGFFVAAEFAIVGAPRAAIRRRANEGSRSARRVLHILDDPRAQDRFIATAQLGITLASLGLGMVGEHALAAWLEPRLAGFGVDRWIAAHTLATIGAVSVLSYFHIVVGEMVPKSLALQHPETAARRIVHGMRIIELGFYPLIVSLNAIGNGVLKLLGIRRTAETEERYRGPEELAFEVRESERGGLLSRDSAEVMQELLEFNTLLARAVMIPRVHVTGIPLGATPAQLREIVRGSPHTRYPVYERSLDDILGMVHVKDILRAARDGEPVTRELLRPATFVADSAHVDKVLRAMRAAHSQMTIVMDEHGGTAGLLTIEDLFEEVVGELGEDESEAPAVARDRRGRLRAGGMTRVRQVGEALGIELSHPRVDTMSGLVLDLLGCPAKEGDRVEYEGLTITVTKVSGRGVAECTVAQRQDAPPRAQRSEAA